MKADCNNNPYDEPENFGLRIVAECNTADSYEFDIALAVEGISNGKVWFATDAGCSCPTAFEDHDFPGEGWKEITSRSEILKALEEYAPREESSWRKLPASERLTFADKVTEVLKVARF